MFRFHENVIIPYYTDTHVKMGLYKEHRGVVIIDVFSAYRCESVLNKLRYNNIDLVFVPKCCTGGHQPLDLTRNSQFKNNMKEQVNNWYISEVGKQLKYGRSVGDLKIDLD